MLKKLLLLLAAGLCLCAPALAESKNVVIDGVRYSLIDDGLYHYGSVTGYSEGLEVANVLSYVNLPGEEPYTITGIEMNAFAGCESLKTVGVTGVGHLTYIGTRAFAYCPSLERVDIGNSVDAMESNAFEGSYALKVINLPDKLETIDSDMFQGRTALESVHIPIKCSLIGNNAFRGCTALTSLYIPGGMRHIGPYAFEGCAALQTLTFEEGVEWIGEYAFANCTSLAEIEFPHTITRLERYAFSNLGVETLDLRGLDYFNRSTSEDASYSFAGSRKLKTVYMTEMSDPRNNYASYMFADCPLLETFVFPEDAAIRDLPRGWFSGCTALERVVLPDSISSISPYAFENCVSLSDLTCNGLRGGGYVDTWAFEGCASLDMFIVDFRSFNPDSFRNCGALALVFLEDVYSGAVAEGTTFTVYCRAGSGSQRNALNNGVSCVLLDAPDFALPAGTRLVSARAFEGVNAETVAIPEGAEAIGPRAFAQIPALRLISIPASVESIDATALAGSENAVVLAPDGSAAARFAAGAGIRFIPADGDGE